MRHLDSLWSGLLLKLFVFASLLVFVLMFLICADVLLRNLPKASGLPRGLAWANEVSEALLYIVTLLSAPWLLNQGKHIRVDIVLRALPPMVAWRCEWVADGLALACSAVLTAYSALAAWISYQSGSLTIKTLVTPEYWLLMLLPLTFLLLTVEVAFRMVRLHAGPKSVRDEAISAA